MAGVLVGDTRVTKLYGEKLSQEDAQVVLDLTHQQLRWGKATVVFTNRRTGQRYGRFDLLKRIIYCHRLGENLGTILHEYAHIKGHGHDKAYKKAHATLLNIWE